MATPTAAPVRTFDPASVSLALEPFAAGLTQPVGLASAGDGTGRLFALEQPGTVRIIREDGTVAERPFLDLRETVGDSGLEQGLLGLAFHPGYAAPNGPGTGRFFVNYTDRDGDTVVAEYGVSEDPNIADPGSARVLLTVAQPARNHNGGHLTFGPDGYLYIGLGDGGAAGDRFGNGQNLGSLLGAMLRLDVDGGAPYAVPDDNPFVAHETARPEIWAYGLRNPWRYSFDRATGELYIADVGQNAWEEINLQPAESGGGENYGWPIEEGRHCFQADACDDAGLVDPVLEYGHDDGCSVTGGYVYRGTAQPDLVGGYVFADWCSGKVWTAGRDETGRWRAVEQLDTDYAISTYGQDEAGELYLADQDGGTVYRVVTR